MPGDAVHRTDVGRQDVAARDAADPLARFRDRFVIDDPDRIYLDGNSLGRLSVDVRQALMAASDDWGERAVEGWHDWIELPVRLMLGSGMRLGEVVGLDQRDLVLGGTGGSFVTVRVTKTRVRAVPVSDDAAAALREALIAAPRRGDDEPVFFEPRRAKVGRRGRGRMRGSTRALRR